MKFNPFASRNNSGQQPPQPGGPNPNQQQPPTQPDPAEVLAAARDELFEASMFGSAEYNDLKDASSAFADTIYERGRHAKKSVGKFNAEDKRTRDIDEAKTDYVTAKDAHRVSLQNAINTLNAMNSTDFGNLAAALDSAFNAQINPEKQAQWEAMMADIQPGWTLGQQLPPLGDFRQYLIDLQQERFDNVDADWDTTVTKQHDAKLAKKVESFGTIRSGFAKLWGWTDAKHNTKKSKLVGATKKALTFGLGSWAAGKVVKAGFTAALGAGVAVGALSAAPALAIGGVGYGVYKLVKSVSMAKIIETHELNKALKDRSPDEQTIEAAIAAEETRAKKKRNAYALGALSAGIAYMSADDLLGDAAKKVWQGIRTGFIYSPFGLIAQNLFGDSAPQPSASVQPTDGGETATPTAEDTATPESTASASVEPTEAPVEQPTPEATASASSEATGITDQPEATASVSSGPTDAETASPEPTSTESSPTDSADTETPAPVDVDPAAVQEAQDTYKEARIEYRDAVASGTATQEELSSLDEARKAARADYASLAGISETEARLEVGDMLATEEVADAKAGVSDARADLRDAEQSLAKANKEISDAKAILEQEPNNVPAQEQLEQAKADKELALQDVEDGKAALGEAKADLEKAQGWQNDISDQMNDSATTGDTSTGGDTPTDISKIDLDKYNISKDAYKVVQGEGWFNTFQEMGISEQHNTAMLREVGPQLEKIGWAYPAKDLGGYGISKPGQLPPEAMKIMVFTAVKNGWIK